MVDLSAAMTRRDHLASYSFIHASSESLQLGLESYYMAKLDPRWLCKVFNVVPVLTQTGQEKERTKRALWRPRPPISRLALQPERRDGV